jgi:hypothetical protein
VTAEQARQLELAALRYSLMLRVAELADLAAQAAVHVKLGTEPEGWERVLEHKMDGVREAVLLVHAARR